MITQEQSVFHPIPEGIWQLDIEPDALEQPCQQVLGEPKLNTAKPTAPSESTTPPPLYRILEALLFAATEKLSSEQLCGIIRGLTSGQLEDSIRSINQQYRRQGRPYSIVTPPNGYRLVLRTPFRFYLEELYGSVKEARFSRLAIETLAIIAYRQPLLQLEIEAILGQDAGLPLRQLIRRGMIQFQGQDANQQTRYVTTARFLEYFALNKIDDLPWADDLERL